MKLTHELVANITGRLSPPSRRSARAAGPALRNAARATHMRVVPMDDDGAPTSAYGLPVLQLASLAQLFPAARVISVLLLPDAPWYPNVCIHVPCWIGADVLASVCTIVPCVQKAQAQTDFFAHTSGAHGINIKPC